jgi:serine/threonine protein phosphatase PrpC
VQMTAEDDFMVLACDGLFDVYSNKEVVKAVKQEMAAHGDAQKCCEVCVCVHTDMYLSKVHRIT